MSMVINHCWDGEEEQRTLDLYHEDFTNDKVWREVCQALEVNPDEGDAIKVEYTSATINPREEGQIT